MSSTLALAASIAAMDRSELHALVSARKIAAPESVHDPLGLALELLRPDSVTRALQMLDREALTELEALGRGETSAHAEARDRLRGLALLGVDGDDLVPLPEVEELRVLAEQDAGERASSRSASALSQTSTASADTSGWYAAALTSVRRVSALLMTMEDHPAVLGRGGTAIAVSVRELAAAIRSEPDVTGRLLAVVQAAGLAHRITVPNRRGGERALLVPAAGAREWLALPLTARWIALARASIRDLGMALRRILERHAADGDRELDAAVHTLLRAEYPLLPETELTAADDFTHTAETLGLTVGGTLSPPAPLLLEGDSAAALRAAEEGFPPLAGGVYLQPDLSLIVPGPLPADDELMLAEIADAEQWGVAITLRLSPASLRRALRDGYTTAHIRELLERLSLTGIPQPIDYLLRDLERTHTGAGHGADSPLSTRSASLAMGPGAVTEAAVVPDPGVTVDDAAATGAGGALSPGSAGESALDELVERVHAAASAAPGTGELSRRLELAIRDRSLVRVTAAAGDDVRSFTLMPVAITGGRLRATDEIAGVQRTLPLSAITAVEAG